MWVGGGGVYVKMSVCERVIMCMYQCTLCVCARLHACICVHVCA